MNDPMRPLRIIAWGNTGRRDDGVALALAERLEEHYAQMPEVIVAQYHQLGPELAEDLPGSRLVLFLDAHCRENGDDVTIELVEADHRHGLDTHHCHPGQLLALAQCLGYDLPLTCLIGIRAYDMEFGDALSPRTEAAMKDAEQRIRYIVDASLAAPAGCSSQASYSPS